MSATDRPTRVRARTTHTCPCGCGRRISNSRILCVDTWALVPAELKRAAHEADEALIAAFGAIFTWVGEHRAECAGTDPDGAIDQAPARSEPDTR